MQHGVVQDFFTRADNLAPDDAAARPASAFIVGGTGNVVIRAKDSTADITMVAVAGVVYPIQISFLRLTGTTATNIVGLN